MIVCAKYTYRLELSVPAVGIKNPNLIIVLSLNSLPVTLLTNRFNIQQFRMVNTLNLWVLY